MNGEEEEKKKRNTKLFISLINIYDNVHNHMNFISNIVHLSKSYMHHLDSGCSKRKLKHLKFCLFNTNDDRMGNMSFFYFFIFLFGV